MLLIDHEYIPVALTSRRQWVVWRSEMRGEKMTKIPYDAKSGYEAKSNDPATWSNYSTALASAKDYDGIGYVFSHDDPYTGIDLDDCVTDDQCAPWATKILQALNSYSEVSPSGNGIKIWVEGKTPGSAKPKKAKIPLDIIPPDVPGSIEIYPALRFFTVTGWHVEGMPRDIRSANGALSDLYERLRPAPIELPAPQPSVRSAGRKYLERWSQYKIDYAIEQVRNAIDGERHNTRYAMARLLGGLIPHGFATEDTIARALFDAQTPHTAAQRSEYKTILDGIRDGASVPLTLPPEPEQPLIDQAGFALCPRHNRILEVAKSGNGWVCHARDSSTERGWCTFWWDGDGYIVPRSIDPETGEAIDSTSNDVLLNAHRSDTGNAECLAQLYGDDLRYCHTRETWLLWDESRWAADEDGSAYRSMIATVRARFSACQSIADLEARKKAAAWCVGCEATGKLEAALRTAQKIEPFHTTITRWDADAFTAAAIGATLDLRAVVHRSIRRDDYLTMRLGAAYDPSATCPRWHQFLFEVLSGNEELIAYIQRAVGYCLTGDTREQKLFLCHGLGANGKSVFLEILVALLGDYAANASFETFDANRRSESSNDLAALRGKRLVTVIETEDGRRLAEARVKSVTGQDLITCRFLYGEYFSYRPTYKIWLAMNHLPTIRGTDKGIWRRIQLIPFREDFEGREDKTLRDTLLEERDGILQWALEGLRQWWKRGLDTPAIVTEATSKYRAESDQVGRWIIDCCEQVSSVSVPAGTAYQNYKAWCEASGEQPMTQNRLGRILTEKGFDQATVRNTRTWIGLGIRETDDSAHTQ